ncbi:MAG: dockerin type I domain-containing protein [Planctomycetota bacterium]
MRFHGRESLSVDDSGDLVVRHRDGHCVYRKPIVYQQLADGARVAIPARYAERSDMTIGFELIGSFDDTLPSVIDPELIYGTFFGGVDQNKASGSGFDGRLAATTGGDVLFFASTWPEEFPKTQAFGYPIYYAAPFLQTPTFDTYIVRFRPNANGTADRVWCTLFGGEMDEESHDIAVSPSGSIYACGTTNSSSFPGVSVGDSFDAVLGSGSTTTTFDGFISNFNPSGNLIRSTYLGGPGQDKSVAIKVAQVNTGLWTPTGCDASGEYVYVAGFVSEAFPTTGGALQEASLGGSDASLSVLSGNLKYLCYSTLLGGAGVDSSYGIALAENGNVVIVGGAGAGGPSECVSSSAPCAALPGCTSVLPYVAATAFPLRKAGYPIGDPMNRPWDSTYNGDPLYGAPYPEGFIAKLNPHPGTAESQLVFSTFIGGGDPQTGVGINSEYCFDVAIAPNQDIYVVGTSPARYFPEDETPPVGCPPRQRNFPRFQELNPAMGGFVPLATGIARYTGFFSILTGTGDRRFVTHFSGPSTVLDEIQADKDWVYGIAFDPKSGFWISGHTWTDSLPTAYLGNPPAIQPEIASVSHITMDCYIAKFEISASDQLELKYCSYLGGKGNDLNFGLLAAPNGDLYVGGVTTSKRDPASSFGLFPIVPPVGGTAGSAFQTENVSVNPDSPPPPEVDPAPKPYGAFLLRINVGSKFIRGDVDLSGTIDSSDAELLRSFLGGVESLSCPDAADVNDDGVVDGADYYQLYAFVETSIPPKPAAPYPDCGVDTTLDVLGFCGDDGQCP